MKTALIVADGLTEFNIIAWREFMEAKLECQVFNSIELAKEWGCDHIIHCEIADVRIKTPTGLDQYGDRAYTMAPDQSYSGIETQYPEISEALGKSIHYALIKALTEKNPLWSEYKKDRNEFSKPKDRGLHKIEGHCIKPILYNMHHVKDRDRFNRNKTKCAKALVHAICESMILSK